MSESQRPLTKVRFEHGFIPELGMHFITSPDIRGFHIMGETYADAEREALAMVSLIHNLDKRDRVLKLSAVAFEAA